MAYRVALSERARRVLVEVAAENSSQARALALVLLSLRQNPEPKGSRELEPALLDPVPGERIWERRDWWITYKVDKQARTVDVGMIERR